MQRLPKMVPPKVASAMLLTGRRMPVEEAKGWGIVHEIVPGERLLAEAMSLAEVVATYAPLALQAMKAVLRAGIDVDLDVGPLGLDDLDVA